MTERGHTVLSSSSVEPEADVTGHSLVSNHPSTSYAVLSRGRFPLHCVPSRYATPEDGRTMSVRKRRHEETE